ncbi:uncharacterized protein LOC141845662 [Curcuma longa]|uniref:uncharacterized protein LOC141845662 n=1 Tax=Curcuma longa TaxID=136217 RepID=UPI003D9EFCA7
MRREGRQHRMVREGRQHGMVVFERMPYEKPKRIANKFDVVPTRALATKVPPKPTNHSRYMSRCRHRPRCNGCHSHPISKARLKTKGKNKDHDQKLVPSALTGPANGLLDLLTDGDWDSYDDESCGDEGEEMVGLEMGTTSREIAMNGNDDEAMGFSLVRFVWELEDGGNWCVVGEDL